MNNGPFTVFPNPYGDGFHNAAAVRIAVTGRNVQMKTAQAVWTVVAVAASGACKTHKAAACYASKVVVADFVSFVFFFHVNLSKKIFQKTSFGRFVIDCIYANLPVSAQSASIEFFS